MYNVSSTNAITICLCCIHTHTGVNEHLKDHVRARDAHQVQAGDAQQPAAPERKHLTTTKPRQQKDGAQGRDKFAPNVGRREVFTVRVSERSPRKSGGWRQRQRQSVEGSGEGEGEGEREEKNKNEVRQGRSGGWRERQRQSVEGSVGGEREGEGEKDGEREEKKKNEGKRGRGGGWRQRREKRCLDTPGEGQGEGEGEEEGTNRKHEARRGRGGGSRQQREGRFKDREQQEGRVEPVRREDREGEGERAGFGKKQEVCSKHQTEHQQQQHVGKIASRKGKEKGRRPGKETVFSPQHSDSSNARPTEPRNRARTEQETVAVQQGSKVSSDGESKPTSECMRSQSSGSGQRGTCKQSKVAKSRTRSDARDWRERSVEEDAGKRRETVVSALPAAATEKRDPVHSQRSGGREGGEGDSGERKRNRKAARSVPKKTSTSRGKLCFLPLPHTLLLPPPSLPPSLLPPSLSPSLPLPLSPSQTNKLLPLYSPAS